MIRFIAWVYILTNRTRSVLYTGFTTDLVTRIREHSTKRNPDSFTARYGVNQLVYYQGFLSIAEAEQAEKYIKGKTRAWKKALIDRHNSKWKDLSFEVKSALG